MAFVELDRTFYPWSDERSPGDWFFGSATQWISELV
jgi:hypothetical protein